MNLLRIFQQNEFPHNKAVKNKLESQIKQ